MTPKEELIYYIIKKYGPIRYGEIELYIGGNCHGDTHVLKLLMLKGFIRKKVTKNNKHGFYEVIKKKVKSNKRTMSYLS